MDLGWTTGLAIGAGLFVAGVVVLRFLIRRRLPWWPSVAAPLLLWGPAIGLIAASWAEGGPFLFTRDASDWPVNLGWSVLVFFGAAAMFGIVRAFLQSRVVTEEIGLRIPTLLLDAARYLLWLVMIFVVVGGIWGKTEWFTGLFAASAIGTVIIGLALQETLANFFAGISLVSERIYGIGDWVWIDGEEGEVISISRRTTKLRTRQSDVITFPNRMVVGSKVRNESRPTPVHAEFVIVSAAYDAPPNRVRAVLRRACREVPGVLQDPAPRLRVHAHADSGIDYQIKFWVDDVGGMPDVRSSLLAQVWYHFRREGVEIPYPVRELRRRAPEPSVPEDERDTVGRRLRSVPFFQALDREVLDALAAGARRDEYGAGERVVTQGEDGDACYVVESGRLEVLLQETEGERRVATLGAGDLFGEMSLLTGEPRTATVRAIEDARLVRVRAMSLREVLHRDPDLAGSIAEVAALRKEGLLEARAALDAESRARVRERSLRLRTLIRKFFQLPEA